MLTVTGEKCGARFASGAVIKPAQTLSLVRTRMAGDFVDFAFVHLIERAEITTARLERPRGKHEEEVYRKTMDL